MPGARRRSAALRKRDVESLARANVRASSVGLRLNHLFTIHWGYANGPGGGGYRERMRRLFARLRDWMRRRGSALTFVWVVEGSNKEAHVHGLMHVPDGLLPDLIRYLKAQLGDAPEVLDLRAADPARGGATGWFRYMIKGCDARVRRRWCPPNRGSQGDILGKRCGFSSNIEPTSRLK